MVFQWPVPSCLPSLPFQHSKRPTTAQSIAKLNPNQAEYHIQKAHKTIHWFSAHLTYTIPIQNHATDQAKESHSRQHLRLPNASSRKRFIAPQFLETLTYQRRQSILSSSLTLRSTAYKSSKNLVIKANSQLCKEWTKMGLQWIPRSMVYLELWELWDMVFGLFGVNWVMPLSAVGLFACWQGHFGRLRNGVIWKIVPSYLMWCIWKERNNRCFEDSERAMPNLKLLFFRTLLDWFSVWRNHTFSILDLLDFCNFRSWLFSLVYALCAWVSFSYQWILITYQKTSHWTFRTMNL